jgi:hypothetical protein
MVWYNNENINLYEKFITNTELYMKVYRGIDRFFSYEIDQYFFNALSDEYYYFRASHDYDDPDFLFTDLIMVRDWGSYTKRIYYHPERSICVFNGCHQDYFYTGMEKYFF